jgi:hypothetical protein
MIMVSDSRTQEPPLWVRDLQVDEGALLRSCHNRLRPESRGRLRRERTKFAAACVRGSCYASAYHVGQPSNLEAPAGGWGATTGADAHGYR